MTAPRLHLEPTRAQARHLEAAGWRRLTPRSAWWWEPKGPAEGGELLSTPEALRQQRRLDRIAARRSA